MTVSLSGVDARREAAKVLLRVTQAKTFANVALSPERTGAETALVYGTLRRLGSIDYLLERCVKKGLSRVEEDVLGHLRVGAYQLLFLDRVPVAVAVSEAVSAAGRHSVRGFVNGVLRGLARKLEGRRPEDAVVDRDHKVFGTDNLYVVDGSSVPSSLGVNPQVTIMAMASRAAERLAARF